ncbi:hypothetical protein HDK64DRAFT_258906 [Phyllosticta capitalensis]
MDPPEFYSQFKLVDRFRHLLADAISQAAKLLREGEVGMEIRQDRSFHMSHWKKALRDGHLLVAYDDEHSIPKDGSQQPQLLEIGLCVFDPRSMPRHLQGNLLHPDWLPTAISKLQTRHVRVEENLHLVNDESVPPKFFVCPGGCQDHTLYCKTEVAKKDAIESFLRHHLHQYVRRPVYRRVALLFQGQDDLQTLKDLHVDANPRHVALLDLQQINPLVVAQDGEPHPMALRQAVADIGVSYKHAHNAANDATWTLVSGIVTGIRSISLQDRLEEPAFLRSPARALQELSEANADKCLFKAACKKCGYVHRSSWCKNR